MPTLGFRSPGHTHVAEDVVNWLRPIQDTEKALTEVANAEYTPNSRRSCQIRVTLVLNGLSVTVPESQR
jgi:hypothetical protein